MGRELHLGVHSNWSAGSIPSMLNSVLTAVSSERYERQFPMNPERWSEKWSAKKLGIHVFAKASVDGVPY